jgi:hypothetical protein
MAMEETVDFKFIQVSNKLPNASIENGKLHKNHLQKVILKSSVLKSSWSRKLKILDPQYNQ